MGVYVGIILRDDKWVSILGEGGKNGCLFWGKNWVSSFGEYNHGALVG